MRKAFFSFLVSFSLVAGCSSRESQVSHRIRCTFSEGIEKDIAYDYSFDEQGDGLTLEIIDSSGAVKKKERWTWFKTEEQFSNNQITLSPETTSDKFEERFFTFKYNPATGVISNQYPEVPADGKCASL